MAASDPKIDESRMKKFNDRWTRDILNLIASSLSFFPPPCARTPVYEAEVDLKQGLGVEWFWQQEGVGGGRRGKVSRFYDLIRG